MRRYAEKRLQEEKEMRDLVQQVAEGHKNSKTAKEKLQKFKQSIGTPSDLRFSDHSSLKVFSCALISWKLGYCYDHIRIDMNDEVFNVICKSHIQNMMDKQDTYALVNSTVINIMQLLQRRKSLSKVEGSFVKH